MIRLCKCIEKYVYVSDDIWQGATTVTSSGHLFNLDGKERAIASRVNWALTIYLSHTTSRLLISSVRFIERQKFTHK